MALLRHAEDKSVPTAFWPDTSYLQLSFMWHRAQAGPSQLARADATTRPPAERGISASSDKECLRQLGEECLELPIC